MGEIKSVSGIIESVVPYYKKNGPESEHTVSHDTPGETLEPNYFFLLDLMTDMGWPPQKLVDNFTSSPGSGHFSELGQRATIMQQQAGKIMGDVNTVLRSVLNIIYDLKEFRIRLETYDLLDSKKKEEQEAGRLALKQLWMDKVDISKQNSSLKMMGTGQAGFQTLIDAFLMVNEPKDADKLDLNDRIKRIVKGRIVEFNVWLQESEKELRKRYQLQKTYLKSQVNSLKLYSRWAKPYLKAAQQLESGDSSKKADLVKTFNTIILELTLMSKKKLNIASEAASGNLPSEFGKKKFLDKVKRNYWSCVLIDFYFRGIPQRVQQSHFVFGGKADVTFKTYVLNDDEMKKFEEAYNDSEVTDVLGLIEGTTDESLKALQEEIDFFLEEKEEEKPKEKKPRDESNPFLAMFGVYDKKKGGEKKKEAPKKSSGLASEFLEMIGVKKKDSKSDFIAPDDWIEANHFRPLAKKNAVEKAFDVFDIYKKAHRMESYT